MEASKLQESDKVRIAHSLHMNEEEFVVKRREAVFQSLQKLKIHCSQDKVPHIALLGSGGGQRAMVGLLGSLVQLDKAGLLDCILYLSGVSGSTWCMASLYKEPDWSTKLETVKDKIIERLNGPGVSMKDKLAKLKKYYYGKDNFSLTDVWAVMVVTEYVKEMDERTISEQWDQHCKDPFPIYAAIDKYCKQEEEGDPWFEISPHEAGYSLSGAFVGTSSFSSQFHKGSKKKHQPEFDMLYLQALCGSALADEDENKKFLWQKIKDFFKYLPTKQIEMSEGLMRGEALPAQKIEMSQEFMRGKALPAQKIEMSEELMRDPNSPPVEMCYQVLMDLVDMNLSALNDESASDLDQSIRTHLNDLSGGLRSQLMFSTVEVNLADKEAAKLYVKQYTEDVCYGLRSFNFWPTDVCKSICKSMNQWIWGRNYNFLHNMTDETIPATLLQNETRDYEDAGLLLNSPYFSVLRKERDVHLIISLDFSDGDPFMTVREAAKTCKKLNIPFPEVNIPSTDEKKPKGFYVFKGKNTPTVIHIPLFNVVNCGDEVEAWRYKYGTFQDSYSPEMIADLMEVAGKNISKNREKLLEEIRAVVG